MHISVLLLSAFSFVVSHVAAKEKVVVCYYGTWATYRNGLGQFDVGHINVNLCTHAIYTFVGINEQGSVISLDPYLDLPDNWGRDNFRKFTALKQQNPNLKTILAVGGWNEGSAKYSTMAANPTLRKNFISTASEMVRGYGFDGFDVDWEYPARRDSVNGQVDVNNFSLLLKELREEFDKYGLLLSVAVSSVRDAASQSYDIPTFVQYVDLVHIMTYDMYGAWDVVTGHNAPLHKGEGDEHIAKENVFSVDVAIDYWLSQGCPAEKLVVGLPLYGRTFKLTNANNNGVRAPSNGAGIAGPYTQTNGVIGYNEFCQKLQEEVWEVRYDSLAKVPYAVKDQDWVSYDDSNSLTAKVEYALKYDIAGFMVWSIETDDFHGVCGSEDFPLLRAINRAIGRSSSSTTSSQAPSSATTPSATETAPPVTATGPGPVPTLTPTTSTSTSTVSSTTSGTSGTTANPSICKEEGFNVNPDDCSSFYICVRGASGELIPNLLYCPSDLHWDDDLKTCNYASLAGCNVK